MRKKYLLFGIILAFALVMTSFVDSISSVKIVQSNTTFKEVKIGTQTWMSRNLNVDKFRNGDVIPQVKTAEEWTKAGENKEPAWCYYGNDSVKGIEYGKLYNWYAVNDPRGLAPAGWHLPTEDEWSSLYNYLRRIPRKEVIPKLKSATGWEFEGDGNNESGFSGLPAGKRSPWGTFSEAGKGGFWWSSEVNKHSAIVRILHHSKTDLVKLVDMKESGFSVRCVREKLSPIID